MRLPYRQAKRSEAKPLIGLYGKSHSGKTKTALMLARGYAGPTGKIVMIETEGGRGEVYADEIPGGYDVLPIRESYPPKDYGDAIDEAHKLGAQVLIIDSGSHEWEGPGGVLAMAEANGGTGMQKWLKPKVDHAKHFLLKLQTTPIPLVILCMRAKQPMEEVYNEDKRKKEWVRALDLVPIQSEDILSEMLISGWIDNETHSFHAYASRTPTLAAVFQDGKPLTYATGEALAAYSRGEKIETAQRAGGSTSAEKPPMTPAASSPTDAPLLKELAEFFAKAANKAELNAVATGEGAKMLKAQLSDAGKDAATALYKQHAARFAKGNATQ